MQWVIALAVVLLLIYSAAFRKFTVYVVLPLTALLLLWTYSSIRTSEQEQEAATKRIPTASVELVDLRLSGSNELTGRVRNHSSAFVLTGIDLRIVLKDCLNGNCETIGQSDKSVYLSIPPGQARDLECLVFFDHAGRPRGERQWSFALTGTKGEPQK
jgi:hypothetical protein